MADTEAEANSELRALFVLNQSAPIALRGTKPAWIEQSAFLWWLARIYMWIIRNQHRNWTSEQSYSAMHEALERSLRKCQHRKSWIDLLVSNRSAPRGLQPLGASRDVGGTDDNLFDIVSGAIAAWSGGDAGHDDDASLSPGIDDSAPITYGERGAFDRDYPLGDPNDYPVNNNDPDLPGPDGEDGPNNEQLRQLGLPADLATGDETDLLNALNRITRRANLPNYVTERWVRDSRRIFFMAQCQSWLFYANAYSPPATDTSDVFSRIRRNVAALVDMRSHVIRRLAQSL